MLMSYPKEDQKGRYISLFWTIWSMGAVVGSIIPTAQNWSNNSAGRVNDGTYIAIFVLMLGGSVLALCLVHPNKVIRDDGTKVYVARHASLGTELKNAVRAVRVEPWILLFFPYSFAGLWYVVYQSNDYNAYFFNVRTRSFNSVWYNVGQMLAAGLLGLLLDIRYFKRRTRAFVVGHHHVSTVISITYIAMLGLGHYVYRYQRRSSRRCLPTTRVQPRPSSQQSPRRHGGQSSALHRAILLLRLS